MSRKDLRACANGARIEPDAAEEIGQLIGRLGVEGVVEIPELLVVPLDVARLVVKLAAVVAAAG